MQIIAHDPARFADLPGYPFAENWLTIDLGEGLSARMHYLDEGPKDAPPLLLFHGEPSWSYLYRKMIPLLVDAGFRCLAPDLIGFGKSDKPDDQAFYTYARHVAWLKQWRNAVVPQVAGLFCQDWGGLIGLRLVAARPDLFAGVVAGNTGLPEGRGMSPAFQSWLDFSQNVPELPVGGMLRMGSGRTLSDTEVAAYDAPFPDESYKAGARAFPRLVPLTPEHASVAENKAAWEVLERFDRPFVTCFSDADPITAGGERVFQERVPGAKGQPHRTIRGGGHFLQEDAPDELAEAVVELRGRV